jgi:methyltransferase (TIGR00027 family)
MTDNNPPVRNISDTARWVAYFRAQESKRSDALFRDPYAERLAGERGFQIAETLTDGKKHEWGWVARTYLFDKFIAREVQGGADVVINLAAGLDTRPYRMQLPARLQWVEIDLPEILAYKEEILAGDKPACQLERIHLDLADVPARRAAFQQLNLRGKQITVMSEGLLIYFSADEVASLATDLASESNILAWIIDLASPGQLRLMQRTMGKQLSEAGASFKFGPPEGPNFFKGFGWEPKDVQGLMKTAAGLNRLPAELHSLLPEPKGLPGNYPWTGLCLLKRR